MKIVGLESITVELNSDGYFVKCIGNASTVVFFSGTIQHRDMKVAGISYEDDYLGNAFAATITPGVVDVRYHKSYSDAAISRIFRALLAVPEMDWCTGFLVRYQGRELSIVPGGI